MALANALYGQGIRLSNVVSDCLTSPALSFDIFCCLGFRTFFFLLAMSSVRVFTLFQPPTIAELPNARFCGLERETIVTNLLLRYTFSKAHFQQLQL